MEIKQKVILRTVAGQDMLIPAGNTVFTHNGIFLLTESAGLLWKKIENGAEREELIDVLMKEYDIFRELASEDVDSFINKLTESGIL